ncbi:MAG: hypothetical protein WCG01_05435 [bacterium]
MTNFENKNLISRNEHVYGENIDFDVEFLLKKFWSQELTKEERIGCKNGSMTINPYVISWVMAEHFHLTGQVLEQSDICKLVRKHLLSHKIKFDEGIFSDIINYDQSNVIGSTFIQHDNKKDINNSRNNLNKNWSTFISRAHPENNKQDE